MVKSILARWKIEQLLLAIYLVALIGLLMFPIDGREFRLLGIQSDKWMHIVLFCGLAVLLRWNFSESRHGLLFSLGVAFAVAVATEAGQGMVIYRSAEWQDVLAGFIGATLGATSVDRILSSPILQELLGPIVVLLGLMIGAFFLLADKIGVGHGQFGALQVAGMIFGVLIAVGGIVVISGGKRSASRSRY